jgi:pimeloyl-[acyl-carrier protein] methyl ester esterase
LAPQADTPDPTAAAAPVQVIAMHGWAGEASSWQPWQDEASRRGWSWQCGERGYGSRTPAMPSWQPEGRRVLIAHSLGPHLLPPALLGSADAVVLLASFGRFLPPGPEGQRLATTLQAMAAQLQQEQTARAMLLSFLTLAAAPAAAAGLPPGPAAGPLGPLQRQRLRDDLGLLARCDGLPSGFPARAPVLIVEAAADAIVLPPVRRLLREALPRATVAELAGAGHSLLECPVVATVLRWLEDQLGR